MINSEKLKKIKMLLLDVDGVLTDGSIILGNSDIELKSFNILDGFGITMLHTAGIKVGIITGRSSEAVSKRARELKIDDVFQAQNQKIDALKFITDKYNFNPDELAYVGDDLFDLPILKKVGFSIAVANARDEVKTEVDYITKARGGDGAIREITDIILKAQNLWDNTLSQMIKYD